jgi:hypothetical protein
MKASGAGWAIEAIDMRMTANKPSDSCTSRPIDGKQFKVTHDQEGNQAIWFVRTMEEVLAIPGLPHLSELVTVTRW